MDGYPAACGGAGLHRARRPPDSGTVVDWVAGGVGDQSRVGVLMVHVGLGLGVWALKPGQGKSGGGNVAGSPP